MTNLPIYKFLILNCLIVHSYIPRVSLAHDEFIAQINPRPTVVELADFQLTFLEVGFFADDA